MTVFQISIIEILYLMLQNELFIKNIERPGFKDVITLALRQYPEITNEGAKTWKKVNLYKKHHKISVRAATIIDENPDNKELWKLLHYEHIYPISQILKELIELGECFTKEQIKEIVMKQEIVILSKEEAIVLDGSKCKFYELDGIKIQGKGMKSIGTKDERLNAINARIDIRYAKNKL